jgi:hypothetical protein
MMSVSRALRFKLRDVGRGSTECEGMQKEKGQRGREAFLVQAEFEAARQWLDRGGREV